MTKDDWIRYFFCSDKKASDAQILWGPQYVSNRKHAIKGKIEKYASIHGDNWKIKEFYITAGKRVVAGVRTTPRVAKEISLRAARVQDERFRIWVWVVLFFSGGF